MGRQDSMQYHKLSENNIESMPIFMCLSSRKLATVNKEVLP